MIFVSMVIGVLGGILAMSSLFVSKSARAKEHLETLAKYQGWIGLTMFGWGVWEIIESVLNMARIGSGRFSGAFGRPWGRPIFRSGCSSASD